MKRLIIVIGILLITTAAFAHPYGGLLSYFHERPAYEFREKPFAVEQGADGRFVYTLTTQKFKALLKETWMKDELDKKTYSFFNDGKFYMLSYGEDNGNRCYETTLKLGDWNETIRVERGLYRFHLDNSGWIKASDKPVQIDWEVSSSSESSYSSYFPWRTAGDKPEEEKEFGGEAKNGSVTKLSNGNVVIVIINHSMDDQHQHAPHFFNKTIVLQPSGDGRYNVQ